MKKLIVVLLFLLSYNAYADRLGTFGFEEQLTSGSSVGFAITSCTAGVTHEIQNSVVHSGSYALRIQHNSINATCNGNITTTSDTTGTYYFRVYFRTDDATPDVDQTILTFENSGGGIAQRFQLLTTGVLRMNNFAIPSSSDGSTTLSNNTWYRLEVEVLLSDTVGTITVNLDGNTEIAMTGLDTLNTNLYRFRIGAFSGGEDRTNNTYYDDIAINNETGSFQTSWPGPGKISIVVPASDDTVTWTEVGACSGVGRYDCVNELPATALDLTDYTETTTVQTDRLNLATLSSEIPSSADITVLNLVGHFGGASTTGTNTIRLSIWDDSSTESNGPTVAFCDVVGWAGWTATAFDPGTKTKSDIQNYDIGYEPVSLAQTCRTSSLHLLIEWIESGTSIPSWDSWW